MSEVFRFKKFEIQQDNCSMKVNTDDILLGAWSDIGGKREALDIGTGSGLIAMMLAQKSENLKVTGIEIEDNSFLQASQNAKKSIFNDQIYMIHESIQTYAKSAETKFDLIVSNPPFFSGGTFSMNENKANVRHTIKLSHADLLMSVQRLIAADGHFDLILPYIEGLRFIELAAKYDFYPVRVTEVISKADKPVERLLSRLAYKTKSDVIQDQLVVHNSSEANDYSKDFIALTKDFYLFL
jgi:tRNA1Val (adenine37-N6)-methyltransferase